MDNLNNYTNEELEIEKKKPTYYKRYRDTVLNYENVMYNAGGARASIERGFFDVEEKNIASNFFGFGAENYDELINRAILMYEGEEEFDKVWFLELFENLYNHEIFDILDQEDGYNLCDDKTFILELMERSGAICEIASCANEGVIKQILLDRELLEKIYKKEILTSSNLSGDDILAILLLQLDNFENLTQDEKFMTDVLKIVEQMEEFNEYIGASNAFCIINHVLAENCEKLLQERSFTEGVFNFIEKSTEKCKDNMLFYPTISMCGLAEKMLLTSELASDEELAKRYVKNFKALFNVDKSLIENEEFITKALEECDGAFLDSFELPLSLYSDASILEKYLKHKAKADLGVKGINFDFDSEVFAEIFEQNFDESIEEYMRAEIANVIEKKKTIVVNEEDSTKYEDVISIIQQWAEDEDIIKIGDKLQVIKVPKGEIIQGQLNIGNGEKNKNNIDDVSLYKTIVLDGDKVADILRKIGIDTSIDMDKMQEQYNKVIETLKQKNNEEKLMPQDIITILRNSTLSNNRQNYINLKIDEESGKARAIVSIPHPVYRNEFKNIELDGEELRKIIDSANNSSLAQAESILDEIAKKGMGEVSVVSDYKTESRFRGSEEKDEIIGTFSDVKDSAYLVGGKLLPNGKLSDLRVRLPYKRIRYNSMFFGGLGTYTEKADMNPEQIRAFNQTDKELNIYVHECRNEEYCDYPVTVYDFEIDGQKYHVKEDDWSNGGRYTVIWKDDEEKSLRVVIGLTDSYSECARNQSGVNEEDVIRFISGNPRRFSEYYDHWAEKYDCCGRFPMKHFENLCCEIMMMKTESELKKEKEQEFLDKINGLANQKKELLEKQKGAKELLEEYEELSEGNKRSARIGEINDN